MKDTFIIAEIGINHNGDIDVAKKLIDMAKECGCNAVKFQKRNILKVYSTEFLNSPRISPWGETQLVQKLGLEFDKEEYDEIDKYCKEKDIEWFASAWDKDSQAFLDNYNLQYNKIASPMIIDKDLLEHVSKQGKTTFISTGMASWDEIDDAVNIFIKNKCPFILMHCVSIYPCPDDKTNLNMINTLKKRYDCEIGYSGHSPGILDGVIASMLGCKYIEKHITLDRTMYGSDQPASLEKGGVSKMVDYCKATNLMMGSGKRIITKREREIKEKLRGN